jgi:hypothetical protein
MTNLEVLKDFGKIAESLKHKVMPNSYWEKESLLLKKRIEENKKVSDSIKMSDEKYRNCFTV